MGVRGKAPLKLTMFVCLKQQFSMQLLQYDVLFELLLLCSGLWIHSQNLFYVVFCAVYIHPVVCLKLQQI